VFENRVLRRIFGPKRDGVTDVWRKLHNEELHNLYASPIRIMKSRRMRWAGHVARMREKRNVYRLLVGKPEGNRPQGSVQGPEEGCCKCGNEPSDGLLVESQRERDHKVDQHILERENGVICTELRLAQYRDQWWAVVNAVMNLRIS
jgi:hypothetical protein